MSEQNHPEMAETIRERDDHKRILDLCTSMELARVLDVHYKTILRMHHDGRIRDEEVVNVGTAAKPAYRYRKTRILQRMDATGRLAEEE